MVLYRRFYPLRFYADVALCVRHAAALQKSLAPNFLDKRRIKNTGQLPQYYIDNDHEAIISAEKFKMVQDERKRRETPAGNRNVSRYFLRGSFAVTAAVFTTERNGTRGQVMNHGASIGNTVLHQRLRRMA